MCYSLWRWHWYGNIRPTYSLTHYVQMDGAHEQPCKETTAGGACRTKSCMYIKHCDSCWSYLPVYLQPACSQGWFVALCLFVCVEAARCISNGWIWCVFCTVLGEKFIAFDVFWLLSPLQAWCLSDHVKSFCRKVRFICLWADFWDGFSFRAVKKATALMIIAVFYKKVFVNLSSLFLLITFCSLTGVKALKFHQRFPLVSFLSCIFLLNLLWFYCIFLVYFCCKVMCIIGVI